MTLEEEARFLAGRRCAEQADYLREVAASRGEAAARELRRAASVLGPVGPAFLFPVRDPRPPCMSENPHTPGAELAPPGPENLAQVLDL